MKRAGAIVISLLPWLGLGCHHHSSPVDAGIPCQSNADCPGGLACVSSICTHCDSDSQCDPDRLCDATSLLCVFRPGWGDQCKLNADCPAGQVCHQGLCAAQSTVTLCLNPTSPTACPTGQRCNATNNVCEQDLGCFADNDCSPTEICNVGTHQCELRCTDANAATVCAIGFKCLNSRCVQCATTSDCPAGFTCNVAAGRCQTQGQCFTTNDCTVPNICNCRTGTCTPAPPPCSSDEDCCLPTFVCDVPSGQCIRNGCQADQFSPNQTPAQAATLIPGSYPSLTLCAMKPDYYAMQLNSGDQLDVTILTNPLLNNAVDTQILDASQQVLAEGNLAADFTVSAQGNYYIRVVSNESWVNYGLRIIVTQGIPCPPDVYEPNNTLGQATLVSAVSASLPPQGELSVCPGEIDYYKLPISAAQAMQFQVFFVAGQPELDLDIYDSDGTTLLGQSSLSVPPQSVTVHGSQVTNGFVYAAVVGADRRAQNQYYLQVTYP